MKKILPIVLFLSTCLYMNAQVVSIPDPNFLSALIANDVDINYDGQIQESEASLISELFMSNMGINNLDGIEFFIALEKLDCSRNNLSTLDIVALKELRELILHRNKIEVFDISLSNQGGLPNLENLEISENVLSELNVSGLANLEFLGVRENQNLISINIEDCIALTSLELRHGMLEDINIKGCTGLETLDLEDNNITEIDLSDLINLKFFFLDRNAITNLDVSGLTKLTEVQIFDLQSLVSLDATGCSALSSVMILQSSLENLILLECYALEDLVVHSGSLRGELDLSGLTNLSLLDLLETNELTSLDLTNCARLTSLDLQSANLLEHLNLSGCSALTDIMIYDSQLSILDLGNLSNLSYVHMSDGNLSDINLVGCTNLLDLNVSNNQLSVIDASECVNLSSLFCDNNQLTQLFIKNGSEESISLGLNPNLKFICADAEQLESIQQELVLNDMDNVIVNSYCPYTFSSQPYKIKGENIFDFDNTGCNENDGLVPQVKYEISDGMNTGATISSSTGKYTVNLPEGDYTITPVIVNAALFNFFPESITVSFPGISSTVEQDFCITPIGSKDDVEISLIPVDQARPGFETHYRIIYKNNGNTIQSGRMLLNYSENLMDFVSSSDPSVVAGDGTLFWNYENLIPFESRSIDIVMEMNTPVEEPPLNGDDVLSFIAKITIESGLDINPQNNQFVYRQLVVNSFDPNDKTCLDGSRISPDEVGDFVSYMVRFENTGSAEAVNIVVKDSIDAAVFDIRTLIPLESSHPMRTEIEGDIVQFIFKDIYLPFDDANNDGFIVFKLKTWSNLAIGDELQNTAEIYFDFNAPIITNTTSTVVTETTATENISFSEDLLSVHPNPTNDFIIISSDFFMDQLVLFSIDGHLLFDQIFSSPTKEKNLNLGEYLPGTYFLKVHMEDIIMYKKIILLD